MSKYFRIAAAGAALASVAFAPAAHAATQDEADVTATILTALSVTVDPTDDTLDFGSIADAGLASAATIVVAPDESNPGGCPTGLICDNAYATPTFNIGGLAGKSVQVSFVNATETLAFSGTAPVGTVGTLTVKDFKTDLTGNQVTLDSSGAGIFHVGGSLVVQPNQAEGTYNGKLTVSVAYN